MDGAAAGAGAGGGLNSNWPFASSSSSSAASASASASASAPSSSSSSSSPLLSALNETRSLWDYVIAAAAVAGGSAGALSALLYYFHSLYDQRAKTMEGAARISVADLPLLFANQTSQLSTAFNSHGPNHPQAQTQLARYSQNHVNGQHSSPSVHSHASSGDNQPVYVALEGVGGALKSSISSSLLSQLSESTLPVWWRSSQTESRFVRYFLGFKLFEFSSFSAPKIEMRDFSLFDEKNPNQIQNSANTDSAAAISLPQAPSIQIPATLAVSSPSFPHFVDPYAYRRDFDKPYTYAEWIKQIEKGEALMRESQTERIAPLGQRMTVFGWVHQKKSASSDHEFILEHEGEAGGDGYFSHPTVLSNRSRNRVIFEAQQDAQRLERFAKWSFRFSMAALTFSCILKVYELYEKHAEMKRIMTIIELRRREREEKHRKKMEKLKRKKEKQRKSQQRFIFLDEPNVYKGKMETNDEQRAITTAQQNANTRRSMQTSGVAASNNGHTTALSVGASSSEGYTGGQSAAAASLSPNALSWPSFSSSSSSSASTSTASNSSSAFSSSSSSSYSSSSSSASLSKNEGTPMAPSRPHSRLGARYVSSPASNSANCSSSEGDGENDSDEDDVALSSSSANGLGDSDDFDSGGMCVVCQDQRANACFLDCGHLYCCLGCAAKLSKCPICMRTIAKVVKVYSN